ncbi:MAG: hypothetical protein HKM02_06270 [Pseudomonadales bacterium]|nr:hypothetical protein [Pseudomonadales bacterium]
MNQRQFLALSCLSGILILSGCAITPIPFALYGKDNATGSGTMDPRHGTIQATIDGRDYHGFYIVSHGTAVTSSPPDPFFGFPPIMNSMVDVSMNSARAAMSSDDGSRISCQFLFQGHRALGDCQTPSGKHYQMVAQTKDKPNE